MHMPELVTSRLTIRRLVADDVGACHRINAFVGEGAQHEFERTRRWVEWSIRNYEQLEGLDQPPYGDRAIVLRETGEVVGLTGLVPMLAPFSQLPSAGGVEAARFVPEVGLFWSLLPEWRKKGFATEAASALVSFGFESLQLSRLVAGTTRENLASVAVMRRLGMRIESNPFTTPSWFQIVGILDWPGAGSHALG